MKKIIFSLVLSFVLLSATAQGQQDAAPKRAKNFDMANRSADHLMLQFGADTWLNKPDSTHTKGIGRDFNVYIMFDKPFRSSPKFSVAYGLGFGSSNIYFDKTFVNLRSVTATVPFSRSVPGTDSGYFNKLKMTTLYLEAPIELRFYSKPQNPKKSWKLALGVKPGVLLKAYTKGKDLMDKNGYTTYGKAYIQKDKENHFINGTRLGLTARIGYGIFGFQAAYQVLSVFKDGKGPDVHSLFLGVYITGL